MKFRSFFVALLVLVMMLSVCTSAFASSEHDHASGKNFDVTHITDIKDVQVNVQGMAICGDWMFEANKYGLVHVYDLSAKDPGALVATFKLGSYNDDSKNTEYNNHSNQMMFGATKFDENDPFPLLYVSTGNSGNHDKNGAYIAKCAVERISYDPAKNKWSSETVQIIEFADAAFLKGNEPDGLLYGNFINNKFIYSSTDSWENVENYQKVAWGWPASFVDCEPNSATEGKFYIKSARFRTTEAYEKTNKTNYQIGNYEQSNAYIVTEFDLPALPTSEKDPAYGKTVTLYPSDITDQFELPYNVGFTQGGTMRNGRIYYSYGNQSKNKYTRNAIQIIDIEKEAIIAELNLADSIIKTWEPECPAFHGDTLVLSLNPTASNPDRTAAIFSIDYFVTNELADDAKGIAEHYHCSLCGKNFSDEKCTKVMQSVSVPVTHDPKHVPEVSATETETGVKEHWYCSVCQKYYSDKDGTVEVTYNSLITPKAVSQPTTPENNPSEPATTLPTAPSDTDAPDHTITIVIVIAAVVLVGVAVIVVIKRKKGE